MRMTSMARALVAAVVVAAPLALATPAHAGHPTPFPYPDAELTLVNHRGLSPGFPENTIAAFRNSIAMGVDAIEVDLRATKDGHIVILHDDTVDRTTDGTGRVNDLTLAQVKALDAGSYQSPEFAGERIPTFEETLAVVKGTGVRLLLDIKESALVGEIVRTTQAYGMVGDVIVGPRTVQALDDFKALDPGLTTLGFIATEADAEAFIAAGVDYIRLWPDWVTASRDSAECAADYANRVAAYQAGRRAHPGSASCAVERIVSRGTPVWSTTNDLGYEGMDELLRLGVTGILSDVPAVLDQLLEDVEDQRFAAAGASVRDLRDALPRAAWLRPVAERLDAALRAIRAGDAGQGCDGLDRAAAALAGDRIPRNPAARYAAAISAARATLACSRF